MVRHPVDDRRGSHCVFEVLILLREHQVRGDYVELGRLSTILAVDLDDDENNEFDHL